MPGEHQKGQKRRFFAKNVHIFPERCRSFSKTATGNQKSATKLEKSGRDFEVSCRGFSKNARGASHLRPVFERARAVFLKARPFCRKLVADFCFPVAARAIRDHFFKNHAWILENCDRVLHHRDWFLPNQA
jgi:hypothetical protein